ncbi:MAG: STAS domain-containing protein [Giesbergeria sp.]|uniref:STAS domain-containing protein n=1 Tax=Giesbergeria sp. TaxID=2818473 RepID=UPI00263479D7|nr:STAS domain-containing protein [Giesbergeria sp.]MDD2609920.1 STAS domain-containing protein [Giesbergeria sp.]
MALECTISELGAARVACIMGRVDSATAGALEKSLTPLFDTPGRHAIIDFTALDYISSAGLRIVLMSAKRAKQAQARLVLCGMAPHVREVFEISGFLKILEVAADQAAAQAMLA